MRTLIAILVMFGFCQSANSETYGTAPPSAQQLDANGMPPVKKVQAISSDGTVATCTDSTCVARVGTAYNSPSFSGQAGAIRGVPNCGPQTALRPTGGGWVCEPYIPGDTGPVGATGPQGPQGK